MCKNLISNNLSKFRKFFISLKYIKYEWWFCICILWQKLYNKNHQVTESYLRVKNDIPEDGGAVLINSAQIYCRAMDQALSMGVGLGTKLQFTSIYLLWERSGSRSSHLGMDRQNGGRFFPPLPFRVNKDLLPHIYERVYFCQ